MDLHSFCYQYLNLNRTIYRKLARGVGEQRAEEERIVSNCVNFVVLRSDNHSAANCNIVCLLKFYSDNLICVHEYAFRYNRSKFNSTL